MKIVRMLCYALAGLTIAVVGAGQFGLYAGSPPTSLGATNGRLPPPSLTPNSVSSQATLYPDHPQHDYASIAPLQFTGDAATAMSRLTGIVRTLDCTVIVPQRPDYARAECTTPVLKFTDDVEFLVDAQKGLIHFRSASRLGRKDFGVNRARMETIRTRFQN